MSGEFRGGAAILTCEYPPFPGGIATYAGRLAQEVRNAGLPITVIAPGYDEFPRSFVDEEGTYRLLRHHDIPLTAVPKILMILRRDPPDWPLLAADIRSVLLAYVLKPLHRRPYRAMIHGSEVSKFRAGSALFYIVRRAYGAAEMISANSRATLRSFSNIFGPHTNGVVNHLGVDTTWFTSAPGPFEHAELAAISANSTIVCAVGRIEARKGQFEAMRVIALARDLYGLQEPVFVIAGRPEDTAYDALVHLEAQRLNVRTIHAGVLSQADLKRLYRRSTCHVLCARDLPGKVEGFGLVLLEAAAQECPSITTNVGGIPEALGDTGFLAEQDDFDGMAKRLALYGADPRRRTRDGLAARIHAESFSWNTCARGTFPELNWSK